MVGIETAAVERRHGADRLRPRRAICAGCRYRVTAKRKREAQNRLGPLRLDRAGRLVRPGIDGLADTEALRDDVGQVAVPCGVCTEPTNVAAGGRSCPFRHRCGGCEYFHTDPSFQPELRAYLDQLLADRERLAAAVPALSTPCDDL